MRREAWLAFAALLGLPYWLRIQKLLPPPPEPGDEDEDAAPEPRDG